MDVQQAQLLVRGDRALDVDRRLRPIRTWIQNENIVRFVSGLCGCLAVVRSTAFDVRSTCVRVCVRACGPWEI